MKTAKPLTIDGRLSIDHSVQFLQHAVRVRLRRKGMVVAVSGGIDSSVCAALAVRALGREHVVGLSMPDRHSSSATTRNAMILAEHLAIQLISRPIDGILEAAGCYQNQMEALREVFPDYQETWPFKITLPPLAGDDRLNLPRVTIRTHTGEQRTERLPLRAYNQLVAATNFKQRTRTMMTYFHAEKRIYAVCGTPNRLEYDQGFFVRGGDGLSDVAPIAHYYKSQVYQLGAALELPMCILQHPPTTDTFPLEQTQEEFYFAVPYATMDLCLFGLNNGWPVEQTAEEGEISSDLVRRVYQDIEAKRRATQHLHLPTLKTESIFPVDDRIAAFIARAEH